MRRLKVSARACAAFVAIILIAGMAGLWLDEWIERREHAAAPPGLLEELKAL